MGSSRAPPPPREPAVRRGKRGAPLRPISLAILSGGSIFKAQDKIFCLNLVSKETERRVGGGADMCYFTLKV